MPIRSAPFYLISVLSCVALIACVHSSDRSILVRIEADHKIGYIDKAGKMVIPAIYYNGSDFSEGLAAVRENGLYGYIDSKGDFTITAQFDWAEPFSCGLALVYKDDHFYYIDHQGRSAFPCAYEELSSFQHGVAVVRTFSGHRGLINTQGRLVLDTLYGMITDFDDGLAYVDSVSHDGHTQEGVVDTLGHFVIPVGKYATISRPHHGYCLAVDSPDYQIVVDRSGKVVLRRQQLHGTSISEDGFSEDIAPLALYKFWEPESPGVLYSSAKGYMGFIDLHNHVLLNDTTVDDVRPFTCGRAFIRHRGGNYLLVDRHLQRVGNEEYRKVKDPGFFHGYAIIDNDQSNVIIDTLGRVVFKPSDAPFHQLEFLDDYHFVDRYFHGQKPHYGIGAFNGKLIPTPPLDEVDRSGFLNGLLKVIVAGKLAVMNTSGKIVWQDSLRSNSHLRTFNSDYMLRGYFYAYSSPNKNGEPARSGGWALSKNIPRKIRDVPFGPDSLHLLIDTALTDTFSVDFRGYRVYLANTTGDTCWFPAEDSRLNCTTQAQGKDGSWKDIDYLPNSWCGNSYHKIALEPGAYWKFTMPQMDGAIAVNVRLQLEYLDPQHPKKKKVLYSNVIHGAINPAQLWNKRPYSPQGIMDPYAD
ncbi:WG repeat-containing protein [Flavitalea sp. BT771]|uniref:WG repeat-containing protein n=1 Tax=Flavitalea sp. BT771 TaxID=3063329 RepID=UPI0026E37517|nr:WG repeat-containing protein [Flavitalea sp. BT771]MDO6435328.1 WG repeat-containing protein [Flavitalea sp. BT771]MDV6224312.1 WG repeat-containing protein [Flavitalea sp. BT771]